ncbi:MAG: phosphoenolpyruvate--protein phosphotransferase [Burkholderiales bacterium]|nr:phosphoenolpyruvate--protein phosphotransferase [Burkholderiales bacterium]
MTESSATGRKELSGIGVSSGLGFGRARVMAMAPLQLPQYSIAPDQIESEKERLVKAIASVNKEINRMLSRTPKRAPKELKSFLEMFKMLINDQTMKEEVDHIIAERLINVEWALAQHLEEVKAVFENMTDSYLAERGDDIEHAVNRLQEELLGKGRRLQAEVRTALEEVILVTNDLSLADVIWLTEYEDLDLVGIITEKGGPTSHTAVLSQTLFIPAVVGVAGARSQIQDGDQLFVNSNTGEIICNPSPEEILEITAQVQEQEELYSEFYRARRRVAETKDQKHKVKLLANIAMVAGLDEVLHQGAQGVGLFRSEYLFMGRNRLPDEEEQYGSYKELIESMGGRPVTIRTLDVGGDKLLTHEAKAANLPQTALNEEEENPALGLRAIRFTLANPSLFLTQIRAILRAAYKENVKILLPMVTSIEEIIEAKRYIETAKAQLSAEGKLFNPEVPVGIMVEVPAVAIRPEPFLREVDFASLGTNDLVQYTLAVDRGNPSVAPIYSEYHPAVLHLIANTAKAAQKLNKPLSVCGEMGGKKNLAAFFVGLGFEELSMAAMQIPSVKKQIRKLTLEECQKFAKNLLRKNTSAEVKTAINNFMTKHEDKNVN